MTTALSSSQALKTLMRPAPFKSEAEEANEEHIAHMSESIKNADNLDQFMSNMSFLKNSQNFNDRSQQNDQSGNFGSPIKRYTMSAGFRSPMSSGLKSPNSALKLFDAFQIFDSSDEEECTFHPTINQKSSKVVRKNDPNLTVNEHLYQYASEKRSKHHDNNNSYDTKLQERMTSSKINKKSTNIVQKKIANALRNIVIQAEKQDSEGHICFEGLGTVLHQLGVFQNLEFIAPEHDGEKSTLSINQTSIKPERLAREIKLHENLWNTLSITEDEGKNIRSDTVWKVLFILVEERIAVSDASANLTDFINSLLKKANKPTYFELTTEKDLWSTEKLVTEFRKLFDNKTSFMNIYSAGNVTQTSGGENLRHGFQANFRPQINSRSKMLDNVHLSRTLSPKLASVDPNWETNTPNERHHRLYKYHRYLSDKKNTKLEARISDELKSCTFSPKVKMYKKTNANGSEASVNLFAPSRSHYYNHTNSNTVTGLDRHQALYENAKLCKDKIQQKAYHLKKKDETHDDQHCTFEPKLNRNYETSPVRNQDFYDRVPNGFKKNVDRLHKGFNERKEYEATLNKIPTGENYHKNKDADFKPPKMLERPKIEREDVLVYVDVSIGPGKTGRIGIHKGDNARALAANFAKTYSLNSTMKTSLESLLQSYIDSYFAQSNATGKVEGEASEHNQDNDQEEQETEEIEGVDEVREDEEEEN